MKIIIDSFDDEFETLIKVTRCINRAFKKFLVNSDGEFVQYMDAFCSIPIYITTNHRLSNTLGLASYQEINNKICLLDIQFINHINRFNNKLLYEVVSHELAHCVDYIIRGKSAHDAEFKRLHRFMKGTGNTCIPIPEDIMWTKGE